MKKKLTAQEIDLLFSICEMFDADHLRFRLVEHFCDCAETNKNPRSEDLTAQHYEDSQEQ